MLPITVMNLSAPAIAALYASRAEIGFTWRKMRG
jgi:hypothetical protein